MWTDFKKIGKNDTLYLAPLLLFFMCLVPINDLGLMPLGGAEALLALYLVQPNEAAGEGGGIEGRSWQWNSDARVFFGTKRTQQSTLFVRLSVMIVSSLEHFLKSKCSLTTTCVSVPPILTFIKRKENF